MLQLQGVQVTVQIVLQRKGLQAVQMARRLKELQLGQREVLHLLLRQVTQKLKNLKQN